MRTQRPLRAVLATIAAATLLIAPGTARAQSTTADTPAPEAFRPPPPPPPPPGVAVEAIDDLPLPGPLPPSGARPATDDWPILIAVAGGTARIDPAAGTVVIGPSVEEVAPVDDWVVAPDGRMRFRTLPRGELRAERRGGWLRPRRWRHAWTLRVGGGTPADPLATDSRVYFGATDNRIYALRRRNGHRIWATDVGSRVTRSPVLWRPRDAEPLLLTVTEGGAALAVLDARSGRIATTWRLPEDRGRLIGAPVPLGDGRFALGLQRYVDSEGALLVLRLEVDDAEVSARR